MPWEIEKRADKFCVVKADSHKVVAKHDTKREATAHLRALYANEPKAKGKRG